MGNDAPLTETALELGERDGPVGKRTWYRRVFFQATIVGLCAFLAPGLYNAMQSTGAGGQQTPYLVMYESIYLYCYRQLIIPAGLQILSLAA